MSSLLDFHRLFYYISFRRLKEGFVWKWLYVYHFCKGKKEYWIKENALCHPHPEFILFFNFLLIQVIPNVGWSHPFKHDLFMLTKWLIQTTTECWTSHSYSLTFLHYRYWRLKARRFTIWRISPKAKMDQWQPCWFLNAVITIKMTGIVWVHLSLTGTSTENMLSFQVTKACAFLTKKLAKKIDQLKSVFNITTRLLLLFIC